MILVTYSNGWRWTKRGWGLSFDPYCYETANHALLAARTWCGLRMPALIFSRGRTP